MKIAPWVVVSIAVFPRTALAALTSSEKAVVSTFVEKGALESAPRVRALAARPDLGPGEMAEPLKKGYSAVAFDDVHRRFTDALLFAPGSEAARNTLAPAVVEALLARAAARMGDVPVDSTRPVTDSERAAIDELVQIHGFVDEKIANAGAPPPDGHDLTSGIRDDAYRALAEMYKAHVAAHRRWFGADEAAPEGMLRLRAQLATTLVDLARGIYGRTEVGDWLGLSGDRRAAFERYGVLVEGGSNARVADAVRLLDGATGAGNGLSLWSIDKTPTTGLVARGHIARAGVPLVGALRPIAPEKLWPEEVAPSRPDVSLTEIAYSAAELATSRATAAHPSLGERAHAAANRAANAGAPGYLSVAVQRLPLGGQGGGKAATPSGEQVLTGVIQLLLLDGQRTIDLALIRSAEGRPEPLEQLALGLSVLAGDGKRATLGSTRSDGGVDPVAVTDIAVENDAVSAFSLAGKHYAVGAGKNGGFIATIDGAPPKLTALANFRPLPVPGDSWTVGPTTYDKLFGDPHAVGLDDGRLVLEGSAQGFDAVASGMDADDAEVSATILPSGAGGGLVMRGRAGDSSYTGVTLRLEPASHKAELLYVGARGKTVEIGPPATLGDPPKKGYAVWLRVEGSKVTAKVGDKALAGTLAEDVGAGRAGLAVLADGRLEVRDFRVKLTAHK
jgi:hypothetical protein